ncbi:serine/threonine-protein kinase PLK1 isoform X1 [Eurytemora carolleeae]|uniref:serine/threonine-protein kinase PLK1 isoform X1 n=1 Tax=Eurytemora carolleeae TaxID=1294199 RepID=UPI000C786959|nr:serine/threonine-protein kinase PLK1 isoform X1 [Eurytemora carolleeae]|eukprot:XP_023323849.1 serine/threonine-protein kinase PLK1-like isoform X1 [Eurytemora affinis]
MSSRVPLETPVVAKEIPDVITDPSTKRTYERGKFLGKGGFAKCYELKDKATGEIVAGKIVPKSMLTKAHQKEKMAQEIRLHKIVRHSYIVKLFSYFEDSNFVYVILELCRKKSLMELHKRRQAITEPETRYFMRQMLLGCQYLHENKIIHRDLKLGNVFLNDDLEIKIGDFGLATKVDFEGERKKTLCGTPNYIAPEVLSKKGHSYEVDVWSLGCILYTLLVGKPPFETQSLKDTYNRIKRNEYHIPSKIGPLARNLIAKLLQNDPMKRPSVTEILKDDFMTMGYLPCRLPQSCLSMAPRFDNKLNASLIARKNPLSEYNRISESSSSTGEKKDGVKGSVSGPSDCHLGELFAMLRKLVESKPGSRVQAQEEEAEDPMSQPLVWVSKWVDYSDKYGFGYSLNDDSIGVVFNDLTKLLLLADGHNIHYIDYDGGEHYHSLTEYPETIEKKVKLLNYFRNYMKEHLLKAGANMEIRDEDVLSRIPSLKTWFRTSRAVVMHLSNGTIQINFFKDHTKIILCPLLGAVTYIDDTRRNRTFRFDLLEKYGCSQDIAARLNYAYDKIDAMMKSKTSTGARKK